MKYTEESSVVDKFGEWFINPDGWYPYCSECHHEPRDGKRTKICPNCGARMERIDK